MSMINIVIGRIANVDTKPNLYKPPVSIIIKTIKDHLVGLKRSFACYWFRPMYRDHFPMTHSLYTGFSILTLLLLSMQARILAQLGNLLWSRWWLSLLDQQLTLLSGQRHHIQTWCTLTWWASVPVGGWRDTLWHTRHGIPMHTADRLSLTTKCSNLVSYAANVIVLFCVQEN